MRRMLGRVWGWWAARCAPAQKERVPIWSVPDRVRNLYSILFIALMGLGVWWLWPPEPSLDLVPQFATWGVGSAVVAVFVAEIGGGMMSLTGMLEDWRVQRLEQARQEGRLEGRQEGRLEAGERLGQAVDEWLARRDAARAAGQEFDEPRPTLESLDFR